MRRCSRHDPVGQQHARSLGPTQCEAREADLHEKRITPERSGRDHAHRLAGDEAELTQAPRDHVARLGVLDLSDQCALALGKFGEPHESRANKNDSQF